MLYYDRMKAVRQDRDATQAEVAKILGISQPQYQLYESGKRSIPVDLLTVFCRYFDVSADYILGLPRDGEWPR